MPRNIALLTLCALGMAPLQGFAVPRIECREPVYDFGEVANTQSIEHEFVLENTGDEPLKFGRARGCCGMTIDFKATELPPGSNVSCRVVFSPSGREGPQRKSAYVASNDPRRPYFELTLKGTTRSLVQVRPASLQLGDLTFQKTSETKISIAMKPDQAFSITNAVSSHKSVVCSYQSVPGGWDVTVRLVPPLPAGVLRGVVRLQTDRPTLPHIDIPYYGTVDVAVVCVPSEITIVAPDPQSELYAAKPFYVLVRATDRKPYKVEKILVPTEEIRATVEPMRAGLSQIRLDGLRPDPALHGEEIVVFMDHPEMQELHIPIKVIPSP